MRDNSIKDLIKAIAVLFWWRLLLFLGFRQVTVSPDHADALLRVAARDPDQRPIVEALLDARE